MKINFSDGYINTKASGNTVCGAVGHQLYFIACKIARETKKDFQYCLNTVLKEYKKLLKTTEDI